VRERRILLFHPGFIAMRKFFSVALLFALLASPVRDSKSQAPTPVPSSGGDAKTTVTTDPQTGAKSIVATPTDAAKAAAPAQSGKTVILWISVDGFRGDYIDRGLTPFLSSLMEHGIYTKQLTPVFPSLTFPNHVSEATGVLPGVHGIVSNKFYDTTMANQFNMPSDPNMLQSEPIWLTCARQGVPAAVLDWPLSQGEQALPENSPRAAKFNERYDPDLTDEARMQKCVDAFKASLENSAGVDDKPAAGPFQLLMGYCHDIDSAGHKFGPDSEEVNKALKSEDATLAKIVNQVADIFKAKMHQDAGDRLYVLITTDHGMAPVKNLVSLRKLLGDDVPESVIGLTSGSYALVYLSALPGAEREAVKNKIVANLRESPFAKFWTRDQLPENLQPASPTRTGDIVISLDPGYDFTGKPDAAKVTPIENDPRAMKGMHAYDPAIEKRMLGFTVLSRIGSDKPGVDLGQIENLRIHPTVAKLLGIQPAPNAKAAPLDPLP
jgi:predicted AlkP superfamily pyrophosphatase or phosphodiesterase